MPNQHWLPMLEYLRQSLEADAARRGESLLAKLQVAKLRNQMFWVTYTLGSFVCFIFLLFGKIVAEKSPQHALLATISAIGICTTSLLVTQNAIHNHRALDHLARRYQACASRLRNHIQTDYLAVYRWAAWLFALCPVVFSALVIAFTSREVVRPGSPEFTGYSDILKQLMALTTAVLAAQVALFNFMFGQLLGRYSTTITADIAKHPTIRLLQRLTIILLVILYCFYLFGFPEALLHPKPTISLVFSILSCLVLTLLVANTGIQADAAMRYAGAHIGRRVAKSFGDPITQIGGFWKVMAFAGLDWRKSERVVVTAPPAHPAQLAIKMVAGIFNAAHRALRDNEHEMFVESLASLIRVADSYATQRSKYFGTGDTFFSYLDDHLAVLLLAASKAPNQYLVTNVVATIGALGRIALRLGGPIDKGKVDYSTGHPLFVFWFGLLVEGFNLSHTLMRTTAASEALEQMSLLTNAAILAGHAEQVRVTVLPCFQQLHKTCIQKLDAYHSSLAGECLIKILKIWLFALLQSPKLAAVASTDICEAVQSMVLLQQAIPRQFSLELKDPASVLSVKTSHDTYTLQDICMRFLAWNVQEDWQRRFVTKQLAEILDLLKTVSLSSGADWASVKSYTEAIYEISFLIFKGIPAIFNHPSEQKSRYQQDEKLPQELLERHLGDVARELIEVWYSNKREWFECEHALFAIVGMASVAYKATGRAHAKAIAVEIIARYSEMLDETQKNNGNISDDRWDYLQLCAAWSRNLLGEVPLADKLVNEVAHGRPFHLGFFSGHSSAYGYPEVEFGFTFFLPVLRNLTLSKNDVELFNEWQAAAMESSMLMDTYEKVWAIRGPVQDELLRRRREASKETLR